MALKSQMWAIVPSDGNNPIHGVISFSTSLQ